MLPIDSPDNLFHDGNPATAELGTILTAAFLNGVQGELLNVLAAAGIAPAASNDQLLPALQRLMLPKLKTGVALPNGDIGPIWHDDYNSIMTWQAFTANGAAYTGYASVLIGSLLLDTQPTPRPGYVKSGVANLSRTADAALRAWAMHNGRMVAVGVWAAGQIVCADNADGTTFRVYDVRGEFLRAWDDGRGIDSGRGFGSGQTGAVENHNHLMPTGSGVSDSASTNWGVGDAYWQEIAGAAINAAPAAAEVAVTGSTGASPYAGAIAGNFAAETRPRNTALLATIKR